MVLWRQEVEADGKTVALDSKETLEAVEFCLGFWKDACDESGPAWDDANNNRAYLAEQMRPPSTAPVSGWRPRKTSRTW